MQHRLLMDAPEYGAALMPAEISPTYFDQTYDFSNL